MPILNELNKILGATEFSRLGRYPIFYIIILDQEAHSLKMHTFVQNCKSITTVLSIYLFIENLWRGVVQKRSLLKYPKVLDQSPFFIWAFETGPIFLVQLNEKGNLSLFDFGAP